MEQIITELSKYGLPGVMIAIAAFFIFRMQTIYQQERAEWRNDMIAQNTTFLNVTSKQHDQLVEVTKNSHTILSEIKMMLELHVNSK